MTDDELTNHDLAEVSCEDADRVCRNCGILLCRHHTSHLGCDNPQPERENCEKSLEVAAWEYPTIDGNYRKIRREKYRQKWVENSRFETDPEPLVRRSDVLNMVKAVADSPDMSNADVIDYVVHELEQAENEVETLRTGYIDVESQDTPCCDNQQWEIRYPKGTVHCPGCGKEAHGHNQDTPFSIRAGEKHSLADRLDATDDVLDSAECLDVLLRLERGEDVEEIEEPLKTAEFVEDGELTDRGRLFLQNIREFTQKGEAD